MTESQRERDRDRESGTGGREVVAERRGYTLRGERETREREVTQTLHGERVDTQTL